MSVASSQPTAREREAVIFMPGLGSGDLGPDQSVDGVARRIAKALETDQPPDVNASYRCEIREQAYGPGDCYKSRIATIFRRDGQEESPILDLYGGHWNTTLTEEFQQRSIATRSLLTGIVLFWGLFLLLFQLPRKVGKSARAKGQMLYAAVILFVISLYMVFLLAAIGGTITTTIARASSPNATTAPSKASPQKTEGSDVAAKSEPSKWYDIALPKVNLALLILTALGLFAPAHIKEQVSASAIQYVCALYYIRFGQSKPKLIAQLEELVECAARSDVRYERIHLLSYSFGSIIVLDASFGLAVRPAKVRHAEHAGYDRLPV